MQEEPRYTHVTLFEEQAEGTIPGAIPLGLAVCSDLRPMQRVTALGLLKGEAGVNPTEDQEPSRGE